MNQQLFTHTFGNGHCVHYRRLASETCYHADTPEPVVAVLETVRQNQRKVRLFYGDTQTGQSWFDEHDMVGYIGRSTGSIKVPLLVPPGEIGGSPLLDQCIIRIDTPRQVLYQHEQFRKDDHILTDDERKEKYFQIKNDRERFFNEIRSNNTPFKGVLGYAWKLEYGLEKGFHLHVLLILNGSKLQQDVDIAKFFGEFWKNKITDGNGLYFNCNADKDRYKYLGVGMINYYDTELRKGLKKAAEYLTKTDFYMRMIAPDKGRTFGKGEIKSKSSNRARPREHADSDPTLAFIQI